MELGLTGRTAAVAAASKGLGFATAQALAREGVRVAICGRDDATVEEAADRIGAQAVAMSAATGTQRPPSDERSSAARRARGSSRATRMTTAPASSSMRTIAAPIPLEPPVTSAVRPASDSRSPMAAKARTSQSAGRSASVRYVSIVYSEVCTTSSRWFEMSIRQVASPNRSSRSLRRTTSQRTATVSPMNTALSPCASSSR